MTNSLDELVRLASKVRMTKPEAEEQRLSFVFGTTHIENENVTREMVENAAKKQREAKAG